MLTHETFTFAISAYLGGVRSSVIR